MDTSEIKIINYGRRIRREIERRSVIKRAPRFHFHQRRAHAKAKVVCEEEAAVPTVEEKRKQIQVPEEILMDYFGEYYRPDIMMRKEEESVPPPDQKLQDLCSAVARL